MKALTYRLIKLPLSCLGQTVALVLVLVIAGCAPSENAERVGKRTDNTMRGGDLLKQRDSDNGVTCYSLAYKDGISCVRDTAP